MTSKFNNIKTIAHHSEAQGSEYIEEYINGRR